MNETHKAMLKGLRVYGWVVMLEDIPDDQADDFRAHRDRCGIRSLSTELGPCVPARPYEDWLDQWADANGRTIIYGGWQRNP